MTPIFIQRLSELERRLNNLILRATIYAADYTRARVQVVSGELHTGWLPWLTHRAGMDVDYWAPEVGEQVILLSPHGEIEQGVVLPALYQQKYPATDARPHVCRIRFADGADFSYDRDHHQYTIQLPENACTQIVSPDGVNIVGNVTVSGHIHASGDITDHTRSMRDDRAIYNRHQHSGVQTGLGETKATEQQQ